MLKLVFALIVVVYKINALQIDENNILLYLYYGNNITATSVPLTSSKLTISNINKTSDVKVFIHGFSDDSNNSLAQDMINSFLKSGEHRNIILIDWGKYSLGAVSYFDVFSAKEQLSEIMAKTLISFSNQNGILLDKFHVLGHGFGGQLAGLIGQEIYKRAHIKLGRITGLDPAGPLFLGASENNRLDASDAAFVDVIHTFLFLGYFKSCGTVDFWPNGGQLQRGCDAFTMCSHFRAVEYYIESINSKNLTAWECYDYKLFNQGLCIEGNFIVMGEHVDTSATGQYFLHTNAKSPYGSRS